MLKAAIEKIVSLATPEVYTIGEESYTTNGNMRRIAPYIDRPGKVSFSSLDAIVQAIRTEIHRVDCPVFVNVDGHTSVRVFTTYRQDNMDRDYLYVSVAELPDRVPTWMGHEQAMIALRSSYIETEDIVYILGLLANISDEKSVQTTDNGLTQTVNVKQGVALQAKTAIKPRVKLRPFRTFLEVEQPESEFLLRMLPGDPEKGKEAQVGLFEADGGAWKLQAKHNIADYFREKLAELIEAGKVIVAE